MSKNPRILAILFVLVSIALPFAELLAQAYPRYRVALTKGMTLSEVQSRWGAPAQITEEGLIHRITWQYPAIKNAPAATLVFRNGGLFSINGQDLDMVSAESGKLDKQALSNSNAKQKLASNKPRQTFMAVKDPKALTEILKEVPSEPDGPGSDKNADRQVSPAQIE